MAVREKPYAVLMWNRVAKFQPSPKLASARSCRLLLAIEESAGLSSEKVAIGAGA